MILIIDDKVYKGQMLTSQSNTEFRWGNQQMDNPEKLATLDTQDTGRRQTNQNTHHDTQANTNTCSINTKAIR
jgi:hypothetical protein